MGIYAVTAAPRQREHRQELSFRAYSPSAAFYLAGINHFVGEGLPIPADLLARVTGIVLTDVHPGSLSKLWFRQYALIGFQDGSRAMITDDDLQAALTEVLGPHRIMTIPADEREMQQDLGSTP